MDKFLQKDTSEELKIIATNVALVCGASNTVIAINDKVVTEYGLETSLEISGFVKRIKSNKNQIQRVDTKNKSTFIGISFTINEGLIGKLGIFHTSSLKISTSQKAVLFSLIKQLQKLLNSKTLKLNQYNIEAEKLLKAVRAGWWMWNLDTNEIDINERWAEIVGYTKKELEPLYIDVWYKLIHPDDIKHTDEALQACMYKKNEYYETDCRMKHKDGHYVWINDRGKVVEWTADGKPLIMSGTHIDITERKNIEVEQQKLLHSLKERVKEQKCLFELANLANVAESNDELLEKAAQIIPQGWQYPEITTIEINYNNKKFKSKNHRTSPWMMETERISKGGKKILIKIAYQKVKPEEDEGVFLKEERSLLESIAEMLLLNVNQNDAVNNTELILQSTDEGIYGIDTFGKCTFINNAAAKMLGYAIDECIEKNMHDLIHYKKTDEATYKENDCPIYKSKNDLSSCRVEDEVFWRKDGSFFNVRYSSTPIVNKGKYYGAVVVFNDITEAKQTQEAIKKSKDDLQRILDASMDMICSINKQGYFVNVSAASEGMLGYKPSEMEGKLYSKFIDKAYIDLTHQAALDILSGKEFTNFENKYVHKNGELVPLIWSAYWDQEQQLIHCVVKDSSEINKTKEQLLLSEKRFKDLVQEGGDLIGILDTQGNYLYVSPTSTTLLGITPEEFVGNNAFDFIHPEDKERVMSSFSAIATIPKIEIEPFRFINKKGEWRWVETVATNMLNNPAIKGVVTNSRDVTERILFNEKLIKNEKRFRALVQEGGDLICIVNLHEEFSYVSPSYKQILGYNEKDLIGKNAFDLFHPEDKAIIKNEFAILTKNQRVISSPYRFKRKDGSYCWIQSKGTNLIGDDTIDGIVINSADISDLLNTQHELTKNNERFELIMKTGTESIWDYNPFTNELFLGDGFYRNFGIEISALDKNNDIINSRIHPSDYSSYITNFKNALTNKEVTAWSMKYRIRKSNGEYAFVRDRATFIRNNKGKVNRVIGAIKNITHEYFYEQLENIEREIMAFSMQENIAISDVVSAYLLKLEHLFEGMKASVLKVEDGKIYNLASPSLPSKYVQSLNGLSIGKNEGSCGTAAYTKKKVVVENVFTDKRWEKYIDFAKKYKFAACWSQPIFNNKNEVIATIANYYKTPKKPNKIEEYAIDRSQRILSIIISKFNYMSNIQLSNERFELLNKATNDAIYDWDVEKDVFYWGDSFYITFGYEKDGEPFRINDWGKLTHPIDRKKHQQSWDSFLKDARRQKWMNEFRFRKADGNYLYVEEIGYMMRDSQGKPIRMIGTLRNVTEVKELQQLLENTSRLAKVGSWEIDVIKNTVYWSDITKEIREVKPDFQPTLDYGINGFAQEDSDIIKNRVEKCKKEGTPWDEELRIITEKGNLKWIRTIGKAEFIDGKCVKIYGSFQDIHERKLNEIALKKSLKTLEDYKFSLDQSAIIAITDKIGVITSVNDNFCKISQYSKEELIGNTHQIINSNHHPKQFFIDLWKTIASGNVWRGDVKNLAKDGSYYWVDTTIVPFLDENNKPFQYLAIRFDITDRKIADEKAIKALEERNTILESIGDAFFAVDKNWEVTYWNKEAENVLGTKREDIVGKNLWEVYKDAIGLKFYTEYHKAIKTKQVVHFEEFYPTTNNWFEVSAYPSEKGLSIYFKDVTIRKVAEEQIRQSNERFEKVTEATNDAIWDWDIINNQLYWGKGYTTLFGYDVANNAPSLDSWATRVHPDDAVNILKSLDDITKDTNSVTWQHEYRYKKENGEYTYVIDRGVVIRDEKGKAIRMVGAMTDVSYQKEHEESLKNLNNQLLKYTNELVRSNEELEQFAYVASHDLQEPLRMVTSFLSHLEKKYSDQLDEKAHTYIDFAVDGANRMRNIILDLLKFSRVGKNDDELESVNITEIVEQANVLLRKVIEEKKATITYKNLPTLMAYRSPMVQVFQNLISNGLKYAKADVAPIIEIKAKELKNEWQFAIKDNGIGIKKDYHEKIFVIFQRLHNKEEYSGTGMGLSIVKKIVGNLGGKIWLESEEGKGSTFYFTIPKQHGLLH